MRRDTGGWCDMSGCPLLERSDQKLGADLGLGDNAIRKGNTKTSGLRTYEYNNTKGWGEERGKVNNIKVSANPIPLYLYIPASVNTQLVDYSSM